MIYLDNAATTKPSDKALEFAKKFNEDCFFNPSALYDGGTQNKKAIEETKKIILSSLGSSNHEVIFTSCGSESDNQAVFSGYKRGVFVTSSGEHSAIYKSATELKNRGKKVVFISLNKDGSVNQDELFDVVKNEDVSFVSLVHVNNETGAINDINSIARHIKEINKDIIFHSDGVQAFMKIPYRLSPDIDLYSISAHKINALKGTGVLLKKKSMYLSPLIYGGGQENGYRSGTENIFGIKVLEYCVKEKNQNIHNYFNRVKEINNRFLSLLNKDLFQIISSNEASPYIISLSAKNIKGEIVMHSLEQFGIIIGNGSACSSRNKYSRVIDACGYKNNEGMIRISFSPYLKDEEIDFSAEKLNETVINLQRIMKR